MIIEKEKVVKKLEGKIKYEELTDEKKEKFARLIIDEMDMNDLIERVTDIILDEWNKDNDLFYDDNEVYKFDEMV